ncbi:GNAT family N-acetyltransferase [Corynebacterium sp. UMB10119B.1]|uniref:GNAT family N-acetyltransferase n=1 Tax=Corynebacterium TaxID=1716 RepID=UPI0025506478|nr:GNAT family N-acetyltransferase [Corynebacterium sp. UMB10119B]MDK8363462.1 GNAT family N-acetyltransferase [Corynebacterium sp. UMB10119B]
MTTASKIRVAGVGDAELVAKLLRDFNVEFDAPVPDNLERRFRQIIARDDATVLLADDIGLAFFTLRPSPYYDGPVAMLEELYVAPSCRNRGTGTALLRRVFSEIQNRNAGELQINVDEVDTDARRFYERHGLTNIEQGSRMLLYAREL